MRLEQVWRGIRCGCANILENWAIIWVTSNERTFTPGPCTIPVETRNMTNIEARKLIRLDEKTHGQAGDAG
jgi:hypothetical protein